MTGPEGDIVWTRWAFYLLFGPPALLWLFFDRDNVRRVIAVLFVLVFVQDSFIQRRFIWALSFGPSTIVAYVAVLSLIVQRGRLPSLSPYGGAWLAFLFFAASGAVAGALSGYAFENFFALQRLFVEGFLLFLVGYLAFRTDEEGLRFFRAFVWVGVGVAAAHFFAVVTGYRFRDYQQTYGAFVEYGGLFNNPNSMGDFYAMVIPAALLLAVRGSGTSWRLLAAAAVPVMLASLFLSSSRGGMLATLLVGAAVLLWTRVGIGRGIVIVAVTALLVSISYAVLTTVLSSYFDVILQGLEEQGLEDPRTLIWSCYLGIIPRRPLGVGFAPDSILPLVSRCHLDYTTAHNIYLDLAAQTGVGSLVAFLFLTGVLLYNVARAANRAADPRQRLLLMLCFVAPAGFLIGGFVEPIFINRAKLNHVFWLFAGVGAAASTRALAEVRMREGARGTAGDLVPAGARGV